MQGQRVAKDSGGGLGWVIAAIVLVLLVGGYIGASIWIATWDRVYPNVTVAGVDVSQLSLNTAKNKLDRAFAPENQSDRERMVEVYYDNYTDYLSADAFAVDTRDNARQALQAGREVLLLNGFEYLRSLFGAKHTLEPVDVGLSQQGQEEVKQLFQRAAEALHVEQPEDSYTVDLENGSLIMTKGYTRRAVDETATLDSIRQAYISGLKGEQKAAALTVSENHPDQPDFELIHTQLYAEMKEAEYDPSTGLVSDHQVGVDFDPEFAQKIFSAAEEGETVEIPLDVQQPKHTREELEGKLFADLLGEATSRVSGVANRRTNVKISSDACHNVVLMPGEVFSYNERVNHHNSQSYLAAPVYVNGKTVYEEGGGLCQASSTIYVAVLHTTLEIVERYNHGFAVGYVPDGMDATVYNGSKDFRFKNNTNYPLKIVMNYYEKSGKNYLDAKIYGTNEDGRYAIPSNSVYDWEQPTTTYVAKDSIPRGTTQVDTEQNSYTGRKARTYRTIYEADGTKAVTEDLGVSKYKMRPEIVYYNPLDGDPATWVNGKPPVQSDESVLPELPIPPEQEEPKPQEQLAPAPPVQEETPSEAQPAPEDTTPQEEPVQENTPVQEGE